MSNIWQSSFKANADWITKDLPQPIGYSMAARVLAAGEGVERPFHARLPFMQKPVASKTIEAAGFQIIG